MLCSLSRAHGLKEQVAVVHTWQPPAPKRAPHGKACGLRCMAVPSIGSALAHAIAIPGVGVNYVFLPKM